MRLEVEPHLILTNATEGKKEPEARYDGNSRAGIRVAVCVACRSDGLTAGILGTTLWA